MTRRHTFDHLVDWLFEARRHIEPNRAVYQIVSCKSDMLDDREVTGEEGKAFADFYRINFIETSAKDRYVAIRMTPSREIVNTRFPDKQV
jgi:hypothetical protein